MTPGNPEDQEEEKGQIEIEGPLTNEIILNYFFEYKFKRQKETKLNYKDYQSAINILCEFLYLLQECEFERLKTRNDLLKQGERLDYTLPVGI